MNSWAFNTCTVLNLLHLLFILVLKLLYLWPNKLVCKYFLRIFFFWLFDLNKELKQLCWDIIQISYISQSVQLNAFYSYRLVQPSSLSTLGTLLLLKKETSHQVALSSFSLPHSLQSSSVPPSCPHELQHSRPPCPSPTPGVYPNSRPSSRRCHPAISSSVIPFSCLQSLPASESFTMSQLFASGGQSIGVSASASVLLTNTQNWFL